MSSSNLAIDHLTQDNRRLVETWLSAFDATWDESQLAQRISQLPPDLSIRWPMLLGLVSIDLRHRWTNQQPAKVEEYLTRFPEIGSRDTVPVSLLQAEYMARVRAGDTPQWEEYGTRFPRHVVELRRVVEQSVIETAQQEAFATSTEPKKTTEPKQFTSEVALAPTLLAPERKMPERLGRYLVLRKLGKGGMGSVYLAHDTQLDREVALKVPTFREDEGAESLQRFFREARAAAKMEHPNICPIYDVGEIDGIRYLTMAYVKGKPLSNFLQLGKPIKVTNAVAVIRKLAQALALAHQKGIIHRDLKPSNIMLNQQSEPILLDFGMAREVFSDQERLTLYGNLAGTPAYMSPEQVKGELGAMGPNCDIYALGVILYQMISGHLPYEGETFTVLAKLLTQDPPSPKEHRPHLDDEICHICMKAMARDLSERYQSMQEFVHSLTGYLRRATTGSRDNVPAVRDATPVRAQPAVNADGTLDLIYFEGTNPGAMAALERAAQARTTAPAPFAPPAMTEPPPVHLPDPFQVAPHPPARQTMLAPMRAPALDLPAPPPPKRPSSLDMPPLTQPKRPSTLDMPPLTQPAFQDQAPPAENDAEKEPATEAPKSPAGDFTKLIIVLGSAAVVLLITLVVVLVLLLNRPDENAKAKPRTLSTVPFTQTQPAQWLPFTPPESRCTILMPAQPVRDEGRDLFHATVGPARYSISWADKTGSLSTTAEVNTMMDSERQRIIGLIASSTLLKEDKITLNGHPGRYWEIQSSTPEGTTTYYIRCYQVQQRMYLIYVTFPLSAEKQAEPLKFFESFKVN